MIQELSIVIPTLNEERFLPKLLASIVKQKFAGKIEVIVVDGNSKDATIAVAERFRSEIEDLQVLKSKRGVSHQRNLGALKAKYPYLLFLDADIILPNRFLPKFLQQVKTRDRFLASAMHIPVRFNFLDYAFGFPLVAYAFIQQFFKPVLAGSFMLTTKENHMKIGGFKDGVQLGEDLDYCNRSHDSGAKYYYYLYPYVLVSPRRLRKEGRVRLFFLWIKGYFHVRKYGPIYDASKFGYQFGKYTTKE